MVNIQVYVIGSPYTARDAENLDLFEFTDDDDSCENCTDPVGFCGSNKFIPLVICDDGDDAWLLCTSCSGAVTNPGA